MRGPIKKGSTDVSVDVYVIDSTDGTPETGYTSESAGIDLWYWREGGTKTSITEVTLATVDAAHSDGGFIHVANGVGRLDIPDAAFAVGTGKFVVWGGTITGMIVMGGCVELEDENLSGVSARLPAALTAGGNIKADALKINSATPSTINEQADAFLDRVVSGTTLTMRKVARLLFAWFGAKGSGAGTTSPKLRNVADTKDVVSMTVDSKGNRSAVTLDLDE